jgi:predicted TIM-barrel fold metal-dependent hydrolase
VAFADLDSWNEVASYPAWDYAERNRISVCLQMTIAGIPMLRALLARFPGVRLLLDHLAQAALSAAVLSSDLERRPEISRLRSNDRNRAP